MPAAPSNKARQILVIKFGALGDMVQALGPFQAIRRHHTRDQTTLLTTPSFAPFIGAARLFDTIRTDGRGMALGALPNIWPIGPWLLARDLAAQGYDAVYDLQTSNRSSFIYTCWPAPKPAWSGIASGATWRHDNPRRDFMHTIERQQEQLALVGIQNVPDPDLSFALADPAAFGINGRFGVLAPGGAAHRPEKRWPVSGFGAIAKHWAGQNIRPVIIGHGEEEQGLADQIRAVEPASLSLVGQTSLLDMAGLLRRATYALGNDSGPMHLAAAAGIPSLVLFGPASDPALCAPRGAGCRFLQACDLQQLSATEVLAALSALEA